MALRLYVGLVGANLAFKFWLFCSLIVLLVVVFVVCLHLVVGLF